jgi:hypothetical protein
MPLFPAFRQVNRNYLLPSDILHHDTSIDCLWRLLASSWRESVEVDELIEIWMTDGPPANQPHVQLRLTRPRLVRSVH